MTRRSGPLLSGPVDEDAAFLRAAAVALCAAINSLTPSEARALVVVVVVVVVFLGTASRAADSVFACPCWRSVDALVGLG